MQLLILGANSEVAFAVAKKFAQVDKANLYLASRDLPNLEKKAQDLMIRYQVKAEPLAFDATDYAAHQSFYDRLTPKPDGVVLAFGYLGDQEKAQQSFAEAKRIIEANYLGAVSILEVIAADFENRGHGFIIGISSVAGERGRQSNYIYGSAKGALSLCLGGLRNRLWKRRIQVMTVLPGFINTKMTEHLNLPAFLSAEPEEAAEALYKAYLKKKNIVYIKSVWKWIMLAIRLVPENLFKRLSL